MRTNNRFELVFPEAAAPKANANVYDLGARQADSGRLRIKALEHENALLLRMVSDVRIEIARLRKLLTVS
jgi:hypothetical protein